MSFEIDFEKPQVMTFVGACGKGKSFLLRNLIKQFSKQGVFKFGLVFSSTEFNPDYDFMPKGSVHGNYSEASLKRYMDKLKNYLEENPGSKLPPNFLILEDLLGILKTNSSIFSNLISTYRHYNMSIFITSQYLVKNVSTLLRELTRTAFIFKTRFKNSQVALFESFGQLCESQDEFNQMLDDATKDKYSCLVYMADKESKEESYISFKCSGDDETFKLKFNPIRF